jgi:hypothetical protein
VKLWITLYLLTLIVFAIFSYTQVDLNLTLFNHPTYLNIQNQLNQLGYYHRDINSLVFVIGVVLLNVFYLFILKSVLADRLGLKSLKKLAILTGLILFLGYNIFSYDLFNYLFDGRILTHYHLNPYVFKPLDFPGDDWIRFMRWTHVPSTYPPAWLAIGIIPSILGLGKFALTLFLFRLVFVSAYLASCWLIFKTTKSNFALALFAFNPLILIEGVLSPHVDMVMASFALGAVTLFLKGKLLSSFLSLLASIGIKYVTALLLPIMNNKIYSLLGEKRWLIGIFAAGVVGTLSQIYLKGVQTWYLLLPMTLLPLMTGKVSNKLLVGMALVASLSIFRYFNLISLGHY